MTDDPDFHLMDERGRRIRKARTHGRKSIFMVPGDVDFVWLVSRLCIPREPSEGEQSKRGVLVGGVTFFDSRRSRNLTEHLAKAPLEGWDHVLGEGCRWTSGHARLPLTKRDSYAQGVLSIEILSNETYSLE
ncbi:hypothetical protein [Asaia astilbis]